MMPRPVLLLFLLVILMITSQFEWKQQITTELESSSDISQKQQQSPIREELVKEKARHLIRHLIEKAPGS